MIILLHTSSANCCCCCCCACHLLIPQTCSLLSHFTILQIHFHPRDCRRSRTLPQPYPEHRPRQHRRCISAPATVGGRSIHHLESLHELGPRGPCLSSLLRCNPSRLSHRPHAGTTATIAAAAVAREHNTSDTLDVHC